MWGRMDNHNQITGVAFPTKHNTSQSIGSLPQELPSSRVTAYSFLWFALYSALNPIYLDVIYWK